MEYQGKNQDPYKGVIIQVSILLIIPLLVFCLLYLLFTKWTDYSRYEVISVSMAFGYGIGTLFFLSCVLSGLFKGTFIVVVDRIKEFFGNLKISFKFACRYYKENILQYGVLFWIYLLVFIINLTITLIGVFNCINLYSK